MAEKKENKKLQKQVEAEKQVNYENQSEHQIRKAKDSGSVTVFFALIFMSILLLTGTLIDISRILVAENKVESATRASTKSVMAEYDESLYANYGLFAVPIAENSDLTFDNYLKKNLEFGNTGFIKFTVNPENSKLIGEAPISHLDVLNAQIEDYMALKAPINSSLRDTKKFERLIEILGESALEDEIEAQIAQAQSAMALPNSSGVNTNTGSQIDSVRAQVSSNSNRMRSLTNDIVKELSEYLIVSPPSIYTKTTPEARQIGALDLLKKQANEIISLKKNIDKKRASLKGDTLIDAPILAQISSLKVRLQSARLSYDENLSTINSTGSEQDYKNMDAGQNKIDNITNVIEGISGARLSESWLITPGDKSSVQSWDIMKKSEKQKTSDYLKQMKEFLALGQKKSENSILSEYALDKFTYLTAGTQRKESYFKRGEIEYLIGDNLSERSNLIIASNKVLEICYSLNITEKLLTGMPLFPDALVAASSESADDFETIYSAETIVPFENLLSSRVGLSTADLESFDLKYSDILYISMLIEDKNTLQRNMLNLIQVNINKDREAGLQVSRQLSSLQTVVSANSAVELELIFLPILPLENLGVEGFKNNSFSFSKFYDFSFQEVSP